MQECVTHTMHWMRVDGGCEWPKRMSFSLVCGLSGTEGEWPGGSVSLQQQDARHAGRRTTRQKQKEVSPSPGFVAVQTRFA